MKLPKGWKSKKVGCLFDVQLGKMLNETARTHGEQLPYLTNYNVQWGRFDLSKRNEMHFSERDKSKFALKKGDLVVCEGGEVGRCAIWRGEVTPCFFQKTLHRLRPINGEIIPEFMFAYMRFISDSKRISDLTTQSSIAHLTREQFCKLDVIFPPLPEQRKIADILSTWDEALEKLDALIAVKERRKKGLMQQLLTGEKRVKEFSKKWLSAKLGTLFNERVEQNREDLPLLAITASKGVVSREDLAKRDTSSEDKSKYLRISPGDIGYNTMRMWQGVSALSSLEGLISPAYTVCVPSEKIDGRFAAHFFKLPHTIHLFHRHSQGLVDDTLNLKYPNFATIEVRIPSDIQEQRTIADILDTSDEELRLLRTQRAAIDQQKRGLMQKLLTGKVRVENKDTKTNKDRQGQTRTDTDRAGDH